MHVFRIHKTTGTYSDLLETYGLANLLAEIFSRSNIQAADLVTIRDKNLYFEIETGLPINDQIIDKLSYFPIFKFVKQKPHTDIAGISDYFDYPVQKELKKERNTNLQKVYKECTGKDKKDELERRLRELERTYTEEKKIDTELDVYTQICSPNNYPGFDKLYKNTHEHKDLFTVFIKEILTYYSVDKYDIKEFDKFIRPYKDFSKNVTATQLYNPNQGQGVNKIKADGLNRKNFDSFWINESMKISGALSDMICQPVKVGSTYDLKVFVPEYKQVKFSFKKSLIPDFKKRLKGNTTPIKIDVLNILLLTEMIIERAESANTRRKKVKDIVNGLHAVYQKDLGQNKAVVNIGFIQVPDFIEISTKEENEQWLDILNEQRSIIGSISTKTDIGKTIETGNEIQGLIKYRNFISGGNIFRFFDFSFWYADYVTNKLHKKEKDKQIYIRLFSVETLNKFYTCMDTNDLKLSDIISDKGFQAVAYAIRKSTVSLQYMPKDNRKFEVRYGLAQTLQTKSKSKEDLAEYIGTFIAAYNAETARQYEKDKAKEPKAILLRKNVKEDDLFAFYGLLDNFSSKLIGALLASYGFALPARDTNNQEFDNNESSEIPEEQEQ